MDMDFQNLTVGLVQTQVDPVVEKNLDKTAKLVESAAKSGAKIVCLQELFSKVYFAQEELKENFKLAEKIPGRTTDFLASLAKKNRVSIVGGSVFEVSQDGKYYNTCPIFDEKGKLIAKYRKMHIPQDPNYYEKFYFSPGDLGYIQVETQNVKISPLICYDQWFPEPARINALKKTQILFYPTAIGWFEDLQKAEPFSAIRWENAMKAHASMNGVFVVAVNRVGVERNVTFWGGSFVADPFGEVIAKASSKDEEVLIAELDLSKIKDSQEGWGFLRNRRPDTYNDLTK